MTTENQKTTPEHPAQGQVQGNTPSVPADSELFAGEANKADSMAGDAIFVTQEGLSAQEVFAGDEDLYKYLADTAKPAKTEEPAVPMPSEIAPIPHKRFSIVQKVLAVSIVTIAAMLLYALVSRRAGSALKPSSVPVAGRPFAGTDQQQTFQPEPPIVESVSVTSQQVHKPKSVTYATQPLSLNVAQTFYLNGNYAQALGVYEKLHQNLSARPEEGLMRDFLQMRMALCMEKAGDYEQANRLFRTVSHSRSPIVRVFANYRCSLLEMQKKQYLNARTRAYQTIALIDAANLDKDRVLSLKRNCCFLAAEAVTRKVLCLCDVDKDLPETLRDNLDTIDDPFAGLNETQLRSILNSGSEQLSKALLSPQIRQLSRQSEPVRYDVTCNSASVEELLARFAANAGLDIHWVLEPTEIGIRKRAVSLHLSAATTQQFVTIASGCAGLLARLNEKGVVDVFNPAKYSYVSEQISLLNAEAVSLWQKFLFRFPSDTHLANAHFALGLLQTQQGRYAEPIAEYKFLSRLSLASIIYRVSHFFADS